MRKPVLITTPPPTVDEVARMLGVPQRRVKELMKILDETKGVQTPRKNASRSRSRGRTR